MSSTPTRRLLALQRTLIQSDFVRPVASKSFSTASARRVHRFLVLPDDGCVDIQQLMGEGTNGQPSTLIEIDGVPVSIARPLDRPPVQIALSSLGTSFEGSANHVPKYSVLELQPPPSKSTISISDMWATIYTLFTLHHHQEHIPVVLSALLRNRTELEAYILRSGLGRRQSGASQDLFFMSRATFWQAAGTTGYHGRGWLPSHLPVPPFPYDSSFTRNDLVIASHPLRPPKPAPGQLMYRRYCPSVKKTLEFHYFNMADDPKGRPSAHFSAFHRWQNSPRVNAGWGEMGSVEDHQNYLRKVLADSNVLPMTMSWDGELMGYVEFFWVKENHLSQYMGVGDIGGATLDWDRGIHVLSGEDKFKGQTYSMAWLRSALHFAFLDDPRTGRVMGEPKFDNEAIMQACVNAGLHVQKIFDFPYKRSALVITPRDRFFKLDLF